MGRGFFHLDLPVTDKSKLKNSDGLGLKSGPIDFAVITPRIDLRPRKHWVSRAGLWLGQLRRSQASSKIRGCPPESTVDLQTFHLSSSERAAIQ